MPSLDNTFAELLAKLHDPDGLNPAKSDPLFYFVHDLAETLAVKLKLPVWIAALEREGWTVEQVSLSDLIWRIVDDSGRWEEWLAIEPDADPAEMNEAIRDVLRSENALVEALARHVEIPRERTLVFLTDASMLHPYFRVRTLESGLHDRVRVPTVLFYPGRRSGQFGLHFLDFYPVDGNYRSTLVGGIE